MANIVCTVNSTAQGDMTVSPDPATFNAGDEVIWQIIGGRGLPQNSTVAFDNILANQGSDNVFSGPGGMLPKADGANWKGKIATDQGDNSEDYTIYYEITLQDGTVLQRHDPTIVVKSP